MCAKNMRHNQETDGWYPALAFFQQLVNCSYNWNSQRNFALHCTLPAIPVNFEVRKPHNATQSPCPKITWRNFTSRAMYI